MERAKALGIPVPSINGFQEAMEKAIGTRISTASAAAEKFVERNETANPAPTHVTKAPAKPGPAPLQGYLMDVATKFASIAEIQPRHRSNSGLVRSAGLARRYSPAALAPQMNHIGQYRTRYHSVGSSLGIVSNTVSASWTVDSDLKCPNPSLSAIRSA